MNEKDKYEIMPATELLKELEAIKDPKEAALFYVKNVFPRIRQRIEEQAGKLEPEGFKKPEYLISCLGFSWQPVLLTAAVLRPKKMLVIGTEDTINKDVGGLKVTTLITETLSRSCCAVKFDQIGSETPDEDMYQFIRKYVKENKLTAENAAIDPTGGKKSMSALAALAGFVLGLPIFYVDNSEYDTLKRRPKPFTEYVRSLQNPLVVFGDLEYSRALNHFNGLEFEATQAVLESIRYKVQDRNEVEAFFKLVELAKAMYERNWKYAARESDDLKKKYSHHMNRGRWNWYSSNKDEWKRLLRNADKLTEAQNCKTMEDRLELICFDLAHTKDLLDLGKNSQAALLTYATAERFVKHVLKHKFEVCKKSKPGSFDIDKKRVEAKARELGIDIEAVMNEIWNKVFQHKNGKFDTWRVYGSKPTFSNSLILLAAFSTAENSAIKKIEPQSIVDINNRADERHGSIFSHGLVPSQPKKENVKNFIIAVKELVETIPECKDIHAMTNKYKRLSLKD
ncbi:MAG: hypothetical protein U5N86_11215 [Planctomycetota bacterium]|nr:hypothetical protein [Planctomycetota bacterium]